MHVREETALTEADLWVSSYRHTPWAWTFQNENWHLPRCWSAFPLGARRSGAVCGLAAASVGY